MKLNLSISIPKWALMFSPFVAFFATITMLIKYYIKNF